MLPSRPVADGPTCAVHDPEIWFEPEHRADAKRLCALCPLDLRAACLIEALDLPNREAQHGVWAGMVPSQRQKIKVRYPIVTYSHARELVEHLE